GPERFDLGDDAAAELVAWAGEREGRVGMQAFEGAGAARPADAEVEARALVAAGLPVRERAAARAPLVVRPPPARPELVVLDRGTRPAVDAAVRLEPRDLLDEMPAGDVVGRRERLSVPVVGVLLRDRRSPERAADDDAAEGSRLAADLQCDLRPVVCRISHLRDGKTSLTVR